MEKDTLRMQFLSGVITEGEYKAIINKEIEDAEKSSLNESMIGGIVGIGAINQIPPRAKADYETAFEHFLGEKYGLNEVEIEEVKIEEGAFGDLLSRMENNTRMAADILTVITLAKEDKEGNAEKAVELLMKNSNLSEEAALEAVTRIFKKAFEWVDSMEEEVEELEEELEEGKEEVVLSNEILNFLEERGIIDPSDAQKVHTDLTAFLNKLSKNPTPDRILSKSDYIAGIEENEEESN
jgi:hypothetical protein